MLEIKNIYKTYTSKNGVSLRALENISLKFAKTGMVFILGKSGSGKSTLLNMIGGLDNFDRGEIYFQGKKFSDFSKEDFDYYHNKCLGFVFQDFCLLNNLTAFQNVELALSLQDKKDNQAVCNAMERVDVLDIKNRKINELPGGIKQRIAIARAIVKKPQIILADEPTGALDSENSIEIMRLLKDLSKDHLVIIVTHNRDLAYEYGDRIIEIRDGFVLKDIARNEIVGNKIDKTIIYSSSLLYIPKDKKMTEDDVNEINSIMSEKRQDYYFLIEQDKKRVASLYPNLKEVFIDASLGNQFVPYEQNDIDLIKQEEKEKLFLPFSKSISFSFSLLKQRISKLLLSILITIFIVTIMGVLTNFSTYSFSKAVAASLEGGDFNYLDVSSCFTSSDPNYRIQQRDLDKMDEFGLSYCPRYNQTLKISGINSLDSLFPEGKIKGFIVTDDLNKLGIRNLYIKNNITDEDKINGIYISSIVANTYLKYNNTFKQIIDMVGQTILISGTRYQILGIFDANYEKYQNLNSSTNTSLKNEYDKLADELYLRLIVSNSFMDNYINNKPSFSYSKGEVNCVIPSLSNADHNIGINSIVCSVDDYEIVSSKLSEIAFFDENGKKEICDLNSNEFYERIKDLKDNEIIIARDLLTALLNETRYSSITETSIKLFNESNHLLKVSTINSDDEDDNYSETYYISNVKIKGVIVPINTRRDKTIYLKNSEYLKLSHNYFCPSSLLVTLDKNDNAERVIDLLYDNGFVITNDFVNDILTLSSSINGFSSLLTIVLISWIMIGTILFYSFMSKSIKDSKRHIGILKALGAKGKDIFKIFMIEAIFISFISISLAILIYCLGGNIFNNILSNNMYSFYFPIFIINPLTIITMIIPPLIAYSIALIIPLRKANSIKPIDVMNRE